ncbi:MAG: hypothetical protein EB084_19535, partial [Proteobacteria bacterium]|nr:hypothetical protein [Pseudomonadota bacterium]
RKLDRLLSQSPNYLIHEFLNEHWRAFYFHEVAAALSACGMRFAGCIPHTRNYPDLCVPATFQPLLRSAETRDTYETHRDFVLDEVFRRDIYVRADQVPPTPSETGPWAWFGSNPLVTSDVPITNPLAQRLLDRLQAAPATMAELAGEAPADVLQGVLQRLCALGALRLYHGPFDTLNANGPVRVTDGFNRALLRDRLMRDNGVRLVSPHTGAVVPLDVLDGLCVTAWEQPSDERATSIAQALTNAGRHLLEQGQPVTDVAQTLARIETRMSTFETRILPVLTTHQIVTPTSD